MMQTAAMAKDKTFNLRLDAEDRARLDVVAKHYAAPAATAVRILIKREHDRIVAEAMPGAAPQGQAGPRRAPRGTARTRKRR